MVPAGWREEGGKAEVAPWCLWAARPAWEWRVRPRHVTKRPGTVGNVNPRRYFVGGCAHTHRWGCCFTSCRPGPLCQVACLTVLAPSGETAGRIPFLLCALHSSSECSLPACGEGHFLNKGLMLCSYGHGIFPIYDSNESGIKPCNPIDSVRPGFLLQGKQPERAVLRAILCKCSLY